MRSTNIVRKKRPEKAKKKNESDKKGKNSLMWMLWQHIMLRVFGFKMLQWKLKWLMQKIFELLRYQIVTLCHQPYQQSNNVKYRKLRLNGSKHQQIINYGKGTFPHKIFKDQGNALFISRAFIIPKNMLNMLSQNFNNLRTIC